jgi:hypothetical protein
VAHAAPAKALAQHGIREKPPNKKALFRPYSPALRPMNPRTKEGSRGTTLVDGRLQTRQAEAFDAARDALGTEGNRRLRTHPSAHWAL